MTPTLQHYACVAMFLGVSGAMIFWARRQPGPRQRAVEVALGVLGITISALVTIWWLQPVRFSPAVALPCQLCDLAGMIAPSAMLSRARWLRTLLHFWGLGLCSQWVFTPVTATGADSAAFWISFLLHLSILFSAFWDFFVRDYRASWRDWRLAVLYGAGYACIAHGMNTLTGGNYGYLGRPRPALPTIVDALGSWPMRMAWIALLGIAALVMVKLVGGVIGSLVARPGSNSGEPRSVQ